jgi:hypothetical protein
VKYDINEMWCIAGAHALGLLDKWITGPLWRLIEDKNVLMSDISMYYTDLWDFFTSLAVESKDVLDAFVKGEKGPPMMEKYVTKDSAWHMLIQCRGEQETEYVNDILRAVLLKWNSMLSRLVSDHLPGGQFSAMTANQIEESRSAPKHNKLSEELFGHLDSLIRLRPSATLLTNESQIVFVKNKTKAWLEGKDEVDRSRIIARSAAKAQILKLRYQEEKAVIEDKKREPLLAKQQKIADQKAKVFKQKETLVYKITVMGLWQSVTEVDSKLLTYNSTTAKMDAIKTQLQFRKSVLQQPAAKYIYQYSSVTEGKFSLEKLITNVKQLVGDAAVLPPPDEAAYIIGCRIRHLFIQSGEPSWFPGRVISQVPGFPDWFNLVYDDDGDSVYTFKAMEDLGAGELEIIFDRYLLHAIIEKACSKVA